MAATPRALHRWALSFLLASALLVAGLPHAQAASSSGVSPDLLEAHLQEFYASQDIKLVRWNKAVRYKVAGLGDRKLLEFSHRTFSYLADITGLDIQEASGSDVVDILLFFTAPLARVAQHENLDKLFRDAGQTDEEYLNDLKLADQENRTITRTGFDQGQVTSFVVLSNPTVWEYRTAKSTVLKFAFYSLVGVGTSNRISPSVMNSKSALSGAERLPTIDEEFLRAFYSKRVKPGMNVNQAIAATVAEFSKD